MISNIRVQFTHLKGPQCKLDFFSFSKNKSICLCLPQRHKKQHSGEIAIGLLSILDESDLKIDYIVVQFWCRFSWKQDGRSQSQSALEIDKVSKARGDCKRPCFDQLNAHILELWLFCWHCTVRFVRSTYQNLAAYNHPIHSGRSS